MPTSSLMSPVLSAASVDPVVELGGLEVAESVVVLEGRRRRSVGGRAGLERFLPGARWSIRGRGESEGEDAPHPHILPARPGSQATQGLRFPNSKRG